jgi:DNA-damage-inducible protein D
LTVEDIHKRKGLAVRDKILDFMGSTELIATLFRISQTEEKLKRDAVENATDANAVHHSVGREVRAAIERVGGTMPEDLPTPEKKHFSNREGTDSRFEKKRKKEAADAGRVTGRGEKLPTR